MIWGQLALICAIKDSGENIGVIESYRRAWRKILSYWWVTFLTTSIVLGGSFLFGSGHFPFPPGSNGNSGMGTNGCKSNANVVHRFRKFNEKVGRGKSAMDAIFS